MMAFGKGTQNVGICQAYCKANSMKRLTDVPNNTLYKHLKPFIYFTATEKYFF